MVVVGGGMCGRGVCMVGGMHGGGVHGRSMRGSGLCLAGGVHGRVACMAVGHVWEGVCMVGGMSGMGACVVGVCVWHRGACMVGGMHGRGMFMVGGMCGRGCAWQGHAWWGACVRCTPQQILRDTVNERAVRILLECILVKDIFTQYESSCQKVTIEKKGCKHRSFRLNKTNFICTELS